jgi:putative endonuclease
MNYYVYILECSDKSLYTGSTNNIEKRIKEHNSSRAGAKYTRGRRPVKLVHIESCSTSSVALKRESKIKKLSRAKKLLLIASGADYVKFSADAPRDVVCQRDSGIYTTKKD